MSVRDSPRPRFVSRAQARMYHVLVLAREENMGRVLVGAEIGFPADQDPPADVLAAAAYAEAEGVRPGVIEPAAGRDLAGRVLRIGRPVFFRVTAEGSYPYFIHELGQVARLPVAWYAGTEEDNGKG